MSMHNIHVQYSSSVFSKSAPPPPPRPLEPVGRGFDWEGLDISIPQWFHPADGSAVFQR